jgi:diguanylate cyclase (GGDEF)-like protein
VSPIRLLALVNPVIGLVFAVVFGLLWLNHRGRPHILLMAGAAASYAVAVSAQLFLPYVPGLGINTLVSGFLFLLSISLFVEAMLVRAGVQTGPTFLVATATLIFALLAYFTLIRDDLWIRLYILNIGAGLLFCWSAYHLRRATDPKPIDRVMFWIVLLIGLHFLPRTVLSLVADSPQATASPQDFGRSIFFQVMSFTLIILALLLGLLFLLAVTLDIFDDLRAERDRDSLTTLLNRRGFEEEARRRLDRSPPPLTSIVFADIDHFKSINDRYGHAAGDDVIRTIGQLIASHLRQGDCAARIGGEEFVVLLEHATLSDAQRMAERLRQQIAGARIEALGGTSIKASFGVAQAAPGERVEQVMNRADEMLYRAKRKGRNRVEP